MQYFQSKGTISVVAFAGVKTYGLTASWCRYIVLIVAIGVAHFVVSVAQSEVAVVAQQAAAAPQETREETTQAMRKISAISMMIVAISSF
ncbi:MAG: hypothetical protein IT267_06030 [Saprospiraceae bacterium]|nr:hypothetical protein [Saprospiraceae bacterium]